MKYYKFPFVLVVLFVILLWSISYCHWPRFISNKTFNRKNWRFADLSTELYKNPSSRQKYSIGNKCMFSSSEQCDNPLNEYSSLEKKEETQKPSLEFPMKPQRQPIRLQNGTILANRPSEYKLQNPMELIPWSNINLTEMDDLMIKEFRDKMFQNDNFKSDLEVESPNKLNDTHARIIAYNVNVNTSANSALSRMTLGQLVTKSLFPGWVWTRLGMNRKIELGTDNTTGIASSPPRISPVNTLPSITFDNNLNRFLKLFTVVRFENTPCVSSIGLNGTCYHSKECADLLGTSTSSCASGFGVCCIFQITCGQTTNRNSSYFVGTGNNFSNSMTACNIQIYKSTAAVKQIRLDFQTFTLQQPNAGSCEVDRFIVSGQNTNIPVLCGENSGAHLYVEVEEGQSVITLSVMTTGLGKGPRRWTIRMTQYETMNPSSAPSHCLQYHTGLMGTVRSFNYISQTSPQYLNNLNYAVCIRKESGFCSVTFTNTGPDGTYMPFQIVNANEHGHLVIPSGQSGVGIRDCPYDYILIDGYRLCGERLNDATSNVLFVEDAPVTDTSNGPCIVTVRTNELDVGAGFFLYYRQNPCMSMSG